MTMSLWSVLSVAFALFAAILWVWSTFIHVPHLKSGFGTLNTILKDGSTVPGEAPFYTALATISFLNAVAAGCACISAGLQAVRLLPG
jgi:hypothetical protein